MNSPANELMGHLVRIRKKRSLWAPVALCQSLGLLPCMGWTSAPTCPFRQCTAIHGGPESRWPHWGHILIVRKPSHSLAQPPLCHSPCGSYSSAGTKAASEADLQGGAPRLRPPDSFPSSTSAERHCFRGTLASLCLLRLMAGPTQSSGPLLGVGVLRKSTR